MIFHNLYMLARACWRKYPMGIMVAINLLLHVVGWMLMIFILLKGSR